MAFDVKKMQPWLKAVGFDVGHDFKMYVPTPLRYNKDVLFLYTGLVISVLLILKKISCFRLCVFQLNTTLPNRLTHLLGLQIALFYYLLITDIFLINHLGYKMS